ncbi:MAG: sensor histidine kinase [Symploca sp. SIO2C1]|nr:sensor histidine kinase [Symploca sp. SIO2C1]
MESNSIAVFLLCPMLSSIPTTFFSHKILRRIDWLFIFLSLLLGIIGGSFSFSRATTFQILIFLGLFSLLSFFIPVGRPTWEKWTYLGLIILVFTVAGTVNIAFHLMMYWTIAKSCFLLSRRDAIITTILIGTGYLLSAHWSGPQALVLVAEKGIERWLNPQYIFLNQLTFYIGASVFTLLFAFIVMAEQVSRRQAEDLNNQVKTLAATLERTRIAREIHDSLGHSLTTLDVQLELAQRLYHQDPAISQQSLHIAKQLTSQCLTEVRRSVQTMRGQAFDLKAAIANLIDSTRQTQALTIHMDIQLLPLPPQMGHQFYCIIQEGLTNVQKHAQATVVTLTGKQDADSIKVTLHDNGKGFNTHAMHDGFGLRGMQERSKILGGELTIQSVLGQGTSLQIIIPCPMDR